MPYIPMNIVQFSIEYRMGCVIAPKRYAIDDLNAATHSDDLYSDFSGLFLEESELIFVKIPAFPADARDVVAVPSDMILSVHPLNRAAMRMIETKVEKKLIGEPVGEELCREVLAFRNRELAYRGGDFLMRLFGIDDRSSLQAVSGSWFEVLCKFRENQNFKPATILEFMMTYERSKDFNRNDVGVLEDAASLLKQYSGMPDGWTPKRGKSSPLDTVLKRLREVAALRSELLESGETAFTGIIKRVNSNPVFEEINGELKFGEDSPLRGFQTIMIYLKLREFVRNRLTGDTAARFLFFVKEMLALMPVETTVALYLAGMRFGIHEFVSLFTFAIHPPVVKPVEEEMFEVRSMKFEVKKQKSKRKKKEG